MAKEPLTLNEAAALCKQYEHLLGHVALGDNNEFEVIDGVIVSPFGKLDKLLFFKLYREMKSAEKAISFYDKPHYDVLVVLRQLVADGDFYIKYIELDSYVNNSGSALNILSHLDNK